jgi:hypothetical protein
VKIPIRLETFRGYGLAFQQLMVPGVEDTQVERMERGATGFRLHLSDGRDATIQRVILAVGTSHFHVVPATLSQLPAELVTHRSAHADVERFRGRNVTVVGAGASAIDLAVFLKDAGANVVLVTRRPILRFNDPPMAHRSLWTKLRYPSSTIGPGWGSFFYASAPWLFYRLPAAVRRHIMRTSLTPAAGWPMKDRFVARIPVLLGQNIERAEVHQNRVRLVLNGSGGIKEQSADHVIAAGDTDNRPCPGALSTLRDVDSGALRRWVCFEIQLAPVMQFACGAPWTATQLSRHLASAHRHRHNGDARSSSRMRSQRPVSDGRGRGTPSIECCGVLVRFRRQRKTRPVR